MNSLPSDILGNIFGLLPFTDAIRSRDVCTRWKSVIENPFFLKTYFPKFKAEKCPPTMGPRAIVNLANRYGEAKVLSLQNCMLLTDTLLKEIKVKTHVLKIKKCLRITEEGIKSLLDNLQSPAKIKLGVGATLNLSIIFEACIEKGIRIQELKLVGSTYDVNTIYNKRLLSLRTLDKINIAFIKYVISGLFVSPCRLVILKEKWVDDKTLLALANRDISYTYFKSDYIQLHVGRPQSLETTIPFFIPKNPGFTTQIEVFPNSIQKIDFMGIYDPNYRFHLIQQLLNSCSIYTSISKIQNRFVPFILRNCTKLTIDDYENYGIESSSLRSLFEKGTFKTLKLINWAEAAYLRLIQNFPQKFTLISSKEQFHPDPDLDFRFFPKSNVSLTLNYTLLDQNTIDAIAASGITFRKLSLVSKQSIDITKIILQHQLDECEILQVPQGLVNKVETCRLISNLSLRKLTFPLGIDQICFNLFRNKRRFRNLNFLYIISMMSDEMTRDLHKAKPNMAIVYKNP